ncbi:MULTISPECIES: hypothetical protein [Streptomyces]|uniref:hypothetical protein n=1 Tax=Streptomyces TaxID=1883 RepID=UPI0033FEDB12
MPDRSRAGAADPRPRARRRSVAIATVLVLTVAAGTAAAVRGGLLRLTPDAAPNLALALRKGGKPGAQVWVPVSAVWVERVAADARATQVTPAGQVAPTPVGVAMPPAAGRSPGWPEKTYTWAELAEATLQGGSLRLGAADPARSATGRRP